MSNTTNNKGSSPSFNVVEIKAAAHGRWIDILNAAGIPAEFLDGKGHPCPRCGGTDRFSTLKDCVQTGAVICRKCFADKNGDGLATLMWFMGHTFQEALRWLADYLGLAPNSSPQPRDSQQRPQSGIGNGSRAGSTFKTAKAAIEALARKKGKPSAMWTYQDSNGTPVGVIVRWDTDGGKDFRPVSRSGDRWTIGGMAEPRPLYRLPDLAGADLVFITEGEKAADAFRSIGLTATTSPHGSKSASKADWTPLKGKLVAIVPDNDRPGMKYARDVATILSLLDEPPTVKRLDLPNLPEQGDAADYVETRQTADMPDEQTRAEIIALVEATETLDSQDISNIVEWEEIEPLETMDVPEFPVDALPKPLGSFVAALAVATQTPNDLAALLVLGVVSATIARRFEVKPRADWIEPVNLFVAVLLEPGNRKSAVFSNATRPLQELERESIDEQLPEIAKANERRKQRKAKLKLLQRDAHKNQNVAKEAEELAAELATEPRPKLPRKIVDDATSEKLGAMLEDQGGRIACMSAEGGVFDLMAGQYSKSGTPVFGVYLMGHAGDDLRVDRISRASIFVKRPALTMGLAIQPEVVRGLGHKAAFRGRGLLARFLYAIPKSPIGERDSDPPSVPQEVYAEYRELIRWLDALGPPSDGEGPVYLKLADDAYQVLLNWMDEIENMLADGGEMEMFKDWGGKLAGHTVRLAAAIHCIKHERPWDDEMDCESLNAAITIARYLIPHAEVVLTMMEAEVNKKFEDARYLLRWIERNDKKSFTKREAHRHGQRRFPNAADIDAPLSELENHGYIREQHAVSRRPGRPASPVYEVNPAVFESEKGADRIDTKQAQPSRRRTSVNSVNGKQKVIALDLDNEEDANLVDGGQPDVGTDESLKEAQGRLFDTRPDAYSAMYRTSP